MDRITVAFNFFRIVDPTDNKKKPTFKLADLLKKIEAIQVLKERNRDIGDYVARLQESHSAQSDRIYDLVKLRLVGPPDKGDIQGNIEPIDLGQDEGIAEHTFFLVAAKHNIIALTRTQYGFNAAQISRYLSEFHGNPLEVEEILNKETLERYRALIEYKTLVFQVALPKGVSEETLTANGLPEMVHRHVKETGARSMRVETTMNRQAGSMKLAPIKALIAKLSGQSVTTSLALHGKKSDGTSDVVDFITDRLVHKELVFCNPRAEKPDERGVSKQIRLNLLKKAYLEHVDYLDTY